MRVAGELDSSLDQARVELRQILGLIRQGTDLEVETRQIDTFLLRYLSLSTGGEGDDALRSGRPLSHKRSGRLERL